MFPIVLLGFIHQNNILLKRASMELSLVVLIQGSMELSLVDSSKQHPSLYAIDYGVILRFEACPPFEVCHSHHIIFRVPLDPRDFEEITNLCIQLKHIGRKKAGTTY